MEDLVSLRNAMNRLMEESLVPGWVARGERAQRVLRLPIDAYTTEEELIIKASVPGLDAEDVEITLEGDDLTIRGEIQPPLENVDYLIQERPFGPFSRTVTINIPIDAEKAEAKFEDGVLTLVLPKAEEVKPKVIKVKSK
jgi:HSP20 family protein